MYTHLLTYAICIYVGSVGTEVWFSWHDNDAFSSRFIATAKLCPMIQLRDVFQH